MKTLLVLVQIAFVLAASAADKESPAPGKSGRGLSVADECWERPSGTYFEFYADGTCRTGQKTVPVAEAKEGKWSAEGVRSFKVEVPDDVFHLDLTSEKVGTMIGKSGVRFPLHFVKKVTKQAGRG